MKYQPLKYWKVENKYIIVTGGLGFIGSNLIARLEQNGYDNIIVVDTFESADKWKNVAKRFNIIHFIKPNELFDFLNTNQCNVNTIIHLGAISSTVEHDVDLLINNNYRYSIELYLWCKQNNRQFIYASSASVYGSSTFFYDSDKPQDINNLRPLNAYGWSKKLIDLYIAKDCGFQENSSKVVALRFFNVYGPNEYHKETQASVMYQFYLQIKNFGQAKLFRSTISVINDGDQKRDFVYVDDCTSLIVWLLEHPEVKGIFNVGTAEARSFNSVASTLFNEMSVTESISYVDMPEEIKGQYQNYTIASIEKLRKVGYFGGFRSIDVGISEYIHILNKTDQYI